MDNERPKIYVNTNDDHEVRVLKDVFDEYDIITPANINLREEQIPGNNADAETANKNKVETLRFLVGNYNICLSIVSNLSIEALNGFPGRKYCKYINNEIIEKLRNYEQSQLAKGRICDDGRNATFSQHVAVLLPYMNVNEGQQELTTEVSNLYGRIGRQASYSSTDLENIFEVNGRPVNKYTEEEKREFDPLRKALLKMKSKLFDRQKYLDFIRDKNNLLTREEVDKIDMDAFSHIEKTYWKEMDSDAIKVDTKFKDESNTYIIVPEVLFVEDKEDRINLMKSRYRAVRMDVVGTVGEALKKLEEKHYDTVISDINVPYPEEHEEVTFEQQLVVKDPLTYPYILDAIKDKNTDMFLYTDNEDVINLEKKLPNKVVDCILYNPNVISLCDEITSSEYSGFGRYQQLLYNMGDKNAEIDWLLKDPNYDRGRYIGALQEKHNIQKQIDFINFERRLKEKQGMTFMNEPYPENDAKKNKIFIKGQPTQY